jgi:FAD/FMN-containing dehydrogenase
MEYQPFFRDVENILRGYEARPHWGKIHHRDAAELQTLYPRFSDFLAMRDRLDPNRVFANDYTKQVFGD